MLIVLIDITCENNICNTRLILILGINYLYKNNLKYSLKHSNLSILITYTNLYGRYS